MSGLTQPLASLDAWTEYFVASQIPILQSTADTLEALRANEDMTDANSIGDAVSGDPLMMLKVLAFAAGLRSQRVVAPAATVTAALVMIGISPFFRAFPRQTTVEQRLEHWPLALSGIRSVLRRSRRCADFALGFSVHRADPNAAAVHTAASLHEFAELLLWLHAPTLALRIQSLQEDDAHLRSCAVQKSELGITVDDLQARLISAWRLPTLLNNHATPESSHAPTTGRIIEVASSLARHSAVGWNNPGIPDDINEVATLLNLSPDAAMALTKSVDPD